MERVNALLVGAPRQGKTFYGEKQLIEYAKNGGCSIVYNVGRPTDFKNFIPVEIMTVQEYRDMWERKMRKRMPTFDIPKSIDFFKVAGNIYHLKDFCKLFAGKCVKIERVLSSGNFRNEDYFIASIYKYFYNAFLMIDDCRTIFRKGLSSEMVGLLSRVNHCGKSVAPNTDLIGIDTMLTYHGFDTVNTETYQFVNKLVQFATLSVPSTRIDNPEIEQVISENYAELRNAEKYSHFEYDPFTNENIYFKP